MRKPPSSLVFLYEYIKENNLFKGYDIDHCIGDSNDEGYFEAMFIQQYDPIVSINVLLFENDKNSRIEFKYQQKTILDTERSKRIINISSNDKEDIKKKIFDLYIEIKKKDIEKL
jgi:hypothetical protein